jgi:hypothetical protein
MAAHRLTLLVLLLLPSLALAQTPLQTPGGPPPGDTVAPLPEEPGGRTPAVAQIYDWHVARGIPATTPWGQAVDTASTRQILSWTTMPEYTNRMVDHLPHHPTVVSPTDHFGYPVGRPGHLHRTGDIHGYFEALAGSSPRVRTEELGVTEEGGRMMVVQVGSERNLARLEEVRQGMQRLADARRTTAEEARALIADLPVLYTFYAGLHSTETGPPEMVMELAYRLAVSEDPMIRTIRDSVVVLIIPVAEPVGRDRVVEWHRRYNRDVFTWEDRVPGPPYWGKYIFHDINRDGLQLTAATTQAAVRHFLHWRYPVGHDLHESVPYLYVSTGTGPYNNTLDPIAISEWQWFSNFEVTALTALGMPGVWTHGFYDGWYPGYLLWVTNNRNAIGRFYETFGSSVPNTMVRRVGAGQTGVEWYRPNPPRSSTVWSLRNNTNYMQSGTLTVLDLTARNRARVLEQFWTKGLNAVERGRSEGPHAWVIPADQARRQDLAYMVNLLRRQGIEVHRAAAAATYGEARVRAGDFVVRMDQPFRNFIQTLFEDQRYPESAPRPYDDVAWTFGHMFNLETRPVADPAVLRLGMAPVEAEVHLPGSARRAGRGSPAWYVVAPTASAHVVRARWALGEVPVHAAQDSVRFQGGAFAPGAWLIEAGAMPWAQAERWARDHGMELVGVPASAVRNVARHPMRLPRVAVLHTWTRTQDDGWVRYTLDHFGIPFTYLGDHRLGEGGLRDRFDVILFPTQGRGAQARQIFQGVDPRFGPLAYTRTEEFPTHGTHDSVEDATGGMGFEGLAALQDFVTRGGTLIAMGSAANLPMDFGLVRGVSTTTPQGLWVPGSLVRARTEQPRHPITYGYGEGFPVFHQLGPYLNVQQRQRGGVVARYAPAGELFLSGLVQNGGGMAGQPAVVTVPTGEGHVVLFGFNPLHRFQNHGNFALVWNAMMHWDRLEVGMGSPAEEEDS